MKIRFLSILLAACLAPLSAIASINGVSVNSNPVNTGKEVTITVSGDAVTQKRCGLSVELGDGDNREVRIETKEALFTHTLTKVYAKPGAYAILVTGKSIFRGFNSYSACEGKAATAVTVASAGADSRTVTVTQPVSQPAASTQTVLPSAGAERNPVVSGNVSTGKRVALVIGNGNYQYSDSLPKLANPIHDAEDIAKALRGFGFEVIEKKDQSLEGMNDAITEFGRKIIDSDAALFYYAGHGLQVKGQNYIIPVNAKIESEARVPFISININQLLEEMESGKSRANIVMLDACRNNPISGKFRSGATRGLAAPSSQPKGTVIVYSTDPGNVAADGTGRNGTFTAGLLAAFKGSDLSLGGVLTRASEEVERSSQQTQTPYINGPATLQKNFQFAPGQVQIASVAAVPDPVIAPAQPTGRIKNSKEIEQESWESARDSGSVDAVQEYLKQYPKSRFAGQAKIHIVTLKTAAAKAEVARMKAEQEARAAIRAESERQKAVQEAQAAAAASAEQTKANEIAKAEAARTKVEMLAVLPIQHNMIDQSVANQARSAYEILTHALAKTRRFAIVERGSSGVADERAAANIGNQLNAKFAMLSFFNGSTTRETQNVFDKNGNITGNTQSFRNRIVLDLRLVDVQTKTVVTTFQVKAGAAYRDSVASAEKEALEDLQAKLEREFSNAFPLTGYIIKANSAYEYLTDLGANSRVSAGEVYILYTDGADVVHPVTGKVIKGEKKIIGEGVIASVQGEVSVLKLNGANNQVVIGQTKIESKPKTKGLLEAFRDIGS